MTLPPKTFRAERLLLKRHGADLEQITFPATDAANVTSGTQEILDAMAMATNKPLPRVFKISLRMRCVMTLFPYGVSSLK